MPENYPADFSRTGLETGPEKAANKRDRRNLHSTNISNAVLLGYAKLTDGARVTYLVLESYDWPDKEGFSKGWCWPSIETLAAARGKSYDTISRHLKELEIAGLIRIESGQDKGMPNCYWLLGPSPAEFAAYRERFPEIAPDNEDEIAEAEKASLIENTVDFEEGTASMSEVLQIYDTRSRNHALPGPAFMPDKEHEYKESNLKKLEFEIDSNPIQSSTNAGAYPNRGGSSFTDQPRSQYISQILLDFSKSLNDLPHSFSNQSQAQNLFRQSGMDEKAFVELLYDAKKRTQWAAIATPKTVGNGPNRAAYFFKVVRNLLEERHRSLPVP